MYAFSELNNIYCCMRRRKGGKKKTLKNFAGNKISEAGISKYRGSNSLNQKAILSGACRKRAVL